MTNSPLLGLSLNAFGWTPRLGIAAAAFDLSDRLALRVLAVHRDAIEAAGPDFAGRIPAALIHQDTPDRVTVGDWILVERQTLRISARLPRHSVFQRKAAGATAVLQPIAANVDTLFLVTSANADFNLARLERYLALALDAQVMPVVVITKADLADDPEGFALRARTLRRDLLVETVDARDPSLHSVLRPWLVEGQTIALLGSSGVGKSTIVNTLMAGPVQVTQDIRSDDQKGRHTTTGRSLHRLAGGAWLMDTPGMRELQIVDVADGIEAVFADIARLAQSCKFSDCSHEREPGCAVQAALAAGALDPGRLKRYRKLLREERHNSEAVHEAHARVRVFGKMARAHYADKLKRTRGWD